MKLKIVAALLSLTSAFAYAHTLPVGTVWQSDYMAGKGQFTLTVVNQDEVALSIDSNTCTFDSLGKITACTRMPAKVQQGMLISHRLIATDRMTMLFSLDGSGYDIVHNLKDEAAGFVRLLKVGDNNRIIDSVRLFRQQ